MTQSIVVEVFVESTSSTRRRHWAPKRLRISTLYLIEPYEIESRLLLPICLAPIFFLSLSFLPQFSFFLLFFYVVSSFFYLLTSRSLSQSSIFLETSYPDIVGRNHKSNDLVPTILFFLPSHLFAVPRNYTDFCTFLTLLLDAFFVYVIFD